MLGVMRRVTLGLAVVACGTMVQAEEGKTYGDGVTLKTPGKSCAVTRASRSASATLMPQTPEPHATSRTRSPL